MLIDSYIRRKCWERFELAAAIANPAHYAKLISGREGPTATPTRAPTGEVGGINYHPPPPIAKLAGVKGGFKVKYWHKLWLMSW